jgi:AAA domain
LDANPYANLIRTGKELLASAKDSPPAIINGVLAAEGIAFVGGEPKVGKSWLICDFCLSVSADKPFMGRYPIELPGRVLYIATEGHIKAFNERLSGIARHKGLHPWEDNCNLRFIWREPLAMLDDPEFLETLAEAAPSYKLIVVDVLADAWTGDENSNKEARQLLAGIRPLTKGGPTIMLVHHFAKSSKDTEGRRLGQRIRGAGSFHATADSSLFLTADKDAVRTTVTLESREDAPVPPFTFTWPRDRKVDGTFPVDLDWRADDGASVAATSMVKEVVALIREQPGQTRTEIAGKTGSRKKEATSAINFALEHDYIHERQIPGTNSRGQIRNHNGLFTGPDPLKQDPGF